MDEKRGENSGMTDESGDKPAQTPNAGKIDDKMSEAQEDAAKERAENGGYQ
ncbi:hypothetical protein [Azospirillum sp. SYSU D00513]|uniref:hypothetical protein n=1 Tax=Azospirillum sp. SYSU D00513 TaxID=2812561 RepID=UPI001A97CFC0|nr:hypothetical protein [Azospirillum sp. SYSU D00513]